MKSNISLEKKNGIYYTPSILADYLVTPLIDQAQMSVFDPAYGEGALLLAAEKAYLSKFKTSPSTMSLSMFGCDKRPVNGLLSHIPTANLFSQDFFQLNKSMKFDTILMNPPYVRHHLIDKHWREATRKELSKKVELKYTADLWTYFLVNSVKHLNKGGSIGAILPWSFIQADYAQTIRAFLVHNFSEINLLTLGAKYFENAKERVILVWLRNYGEAAKWVNIANSKEVSEDVPFRKISLEKFKTKKVVFYARQSQESNLDRYIDNYGFSRFQDHADVRIGVVTGADGYFICSKEEARKNGFYRENLVPIFTTSKEFKGLSTHQETTYKYLLQLTEDNCDKFEKYISLGIDANLHLRSHSLRRRPWFKVNVHQMPNAFFPYRMSKLPYLVLNSADAQSTNSIHRIYFRGLTDTEIKWIQISLMSGIGQLSLEIESKTYGRGMLKIEPSSLKRAIVYKSSDPSINLIHSKVNSLLLSGNKQDAMLASTNFLRDKLNLPPKLVNITMSDLLDVQGRRLDR